MGAYRNKACQADTMKSGRKGLLTEFMIRVNFYRQGLSKTKTNFLRIAYAPIPKRNIFMTITINIKMLYHN